MKKKIINFNNCNKLNLHHLKPKSRKGNEKKENLLLIKQERHVKWHRVFGNLTLYEIILLLIRIAKLKKYENIEPKIINFYKILENRKE
ncbi:MAG: hypothetical protein QXO12_02655 [Candidatus Pacearchaeota archaeon]